MELGSLQLTLQKVNSLMSERNFKAAEKMLIDEVESGMQDVEIYIQLANIFHQTGQLGKAIKSFNKVLELDPQNTDAMVSLSVLYNDIGKYEEATNIFNRANEKVKKSENNLGPSDAHINHKFSKRHIELAELYFSYARYDEALFEFNKARNLHPEDLEIVIKISKTYAKKGFVKKAVEELKMLKVKYPNYIPARVSLGILYYGQGNVIEAQNEWKMALAKEPGNEEILMYLNLSETATQTKLQ